jgi:hypothetical protein
VKKSSISPFATSTLTLKGQGQYSPNTPPTLGKYYLPILKQPSPQPDSIAPVHLLGVKGGVGTSTLALLANRNDKLFDFAEVYQGRRCWVSYLPRVILVTNLTYSSIIALQGVMQQFTDKAQFAKAKYTPQIIGVAVVDNTNVKKTAAVKKLLEYITSGIPHRWDFGFVPHLQDVINPKEAALFGGFLEKIEDMVATVTLSERNET